MSSGESITLTPSARLAHELQTKETQTRLADGSQTWETSAIMPLKVWLEGLQAEHFVTHKNALIGLSTAQAELIWQNIIAQDVYEGATGLAKLAHSAWQTIVEYQLTPPDQWPDLLMNEDQRAYQRWATSYIEYCQRHQLTDFPHFLDALPGYIQSGLIELPCDITLCGFDLELAPAYVAIFEQLRKQGVVVNQSSRDASDTKAKIALRTCLTIDEEISHAAQWAKAHIEAHPTHRVAIVTPQLNQLLPRIENLLRRVLDPPGLHLEPNAQAFWHISLGHPLAQRPLIADLLHLLNLKPHRINQADAGRLLRSPWLRGWSTEKEARHRLIMTLNDREPYWLDWQGLIKRARKVGCHEWAKGFDRWRQHRLKTSRKMACMDWSAEFQKELSAVGYGFGRSLDSVEYQTMQHWHRILESFSGLATTQIPGVIHMTRHSALAQLRNLCSQMLFREQDVGAPLTVMGVREAMGSDFDAIWLSQLDQESWPSSPQRDPFIPTSLQSTLPQARADGCLAIARCQLAGLMGTAPMLQGSYSVGDEAVKLQVTPLLSEVAHIEQVTPNAVVQRQHEESAPLERLPHDSGPPLQKEKMTKGGVGLLNDQAACPFKAFAIHRLHAKDIQPPKPGISKKDRGTMVHDILEYFWKETVDSSGLAELDDQALEDRIKHHTTEKISQYMIHHPQALSKHEQALEIQNIARKLVAWLNIERRRPPFVTQTLEESVNLSVSGLTLSGKPDRIDQLASGERLVIDYKTGQAAISKWNPTGRLRDGQLPVYALTLEPPPAGIGFAKIAKDGVSFDGLSASDLEIDGITSIQDHNRGDFKTIEGWGQLLKAWREQLDALADEYQAGHAAIDPIKPEVCQYCHLKAACRIKEKNDWVADNGEV